MFLPSPASRVFFPKPGADGVSRHTERAGQAAQTGAFLISSENLFAFFRRITVRFWIITAHFAAVVTQIALFAVVGFAIANKIFALTMITF